MSVTFEKNGTRIEVQCYRSLNLLGHAQIEELEIGSRCGGHGVCGGDRVHCPQDNMHLSALTETEREHLSPEDIANGWRLACQAFPLKGNLSIEVRVPKV